MLSTPDDPAAPSHDAPDGARGGGAGVDFVAVDTETTGLAWHETLVELGAVRFRGGVVVATWRTLVNPRRPIPEAATRIHGLTDAQVAEAPDAREALVEFQRFCEGAVLLAHNARFDRDILATQYARAGLKAPAERMYCTWRLAHRCIEGSPRYGLAALAEHLRLPAESPHRALADAELTRRLFLACCERLDGGCTLASLDAAATEAGAPWSFDGAVRSVRDLPRRLRALRTARALGRPVRVTVRGDDGAPAVELTGVPEGFYARESEVVMDLGRGAWSTSVPLARVIAAGAVDERAT